MLQQPVHAGAGRRIVPADAHRRQPDQRLPGSVHVVDAPAAEPTAVRLLRAAHVFDGPIDRRIAHAAPQDAEHLQHPAGQVGRAGIDHGIVIGEGHAAEKLVIVVAIEGAPAAVAILHGQHPVDRATRGRGHLIEPHQVPPGAGQAGAGPMIDQLHARSLGIGRAAGAFHLPGQGHHDHDRVVNVGVEFVGVLEAPAARRGVDRLRPIACAAHFLLEQPIHARCAHGSSLVVPAADTARRLIAVSHTGDLQGCKRAVSCSSITRPRKRSRQYCISRLSSA